MAHTASQNEPNKPELGLQANRQKYWKELNTNEKIERLRTLVKSMVSENNNLRSQINTLKRHRHNAEGRAVTIKNLEDEYGETLVSGFGTAYPGAKEDEVYI